MDASSKRRPKVRELLGENVIFDGYGGARCPWCPYHQELFLSGNFNRHILVKHPAEAEEKGFTACKRRGDDAADEIPESLANLVRSDKAGVHCQITNGQCKYSQPTFNVQRFQRHMCLIHPWNAMVWNLSIEETGGSYPKLHQMILQFVTYDAHGIYCKIDPDSKCPYWWPSMNTNSMKLHFMDHHQGLAERYGFFEDIIDRPKKPAKDPFRLGKSKLETDFYVRLYENTYKDDDGNYHCRIDGECSFMQRKFLSRKFLRHFCKYHRRAANEKNLLGKMPNLAKKNPGGKRYDLPVKNVSGKYSGKVKQYIETVEGGTACRIAGLTCEYVQNAFNSANFRRHFRNVHPKEAKQYGFFKGIPFSRVVKSEAKGKGLGKEGQLHRIVKTAAPVDPLLDIKQEVEADEEDEGLLDTADEAPPTMGLLISIPALVDENVLRVKNDIFCKISTEHCDYSRCEGFDAKDFVRHFRFKHPDEAREKGFFGERDQTTDELPLHRKSFRTLVTENVLVDEDGIHCMISETACALFQVAFNVGNFVRHFRNEHAQEAEERGFVRRKFHNKKRKYKSPKPNRTARGTVSALVKKFILKSESGFRCNISKYFCKYVQTTELRTPNFARHFALKHPAEAQAAGFDVDKQKMIYFTSRSGSPSFAQLVRKYTERDETGIHCGLGDKKCRYVQKSSFSPGNFIRHFRVEHSKEARKLGFFKDDDSKDEAQSVNEASETDSDSESEAESVAQDVKMESFDLEENEPSTHPVESSQDDPLQRKNPTAKTLKELVEKFIFRDEHGAHCRLAGFRPCGYVQQGPFNYCSMVGHFRSKHVREAREAGFFPHCESTSEPDRESVEHIVPDESYAQDETREESQLNIPCADTSHDEPRGEKPSDGPRLNQKQLTEKYTHRDEMGIHCRISRWPCKYVQKGNYAYQNFVRHFRSFHVKEALKAGFLNDTSEPEKQHVSAKHEEVPPVDPDASEDERLKEKNGLPSLRRLTKKFVAQEKDDASESEQKTVEQEDARNAGFFKKSDETSEPVLEAAGRISLDSITREETMESFTTEQSQPEKPDAPKPRKLRRKKPVLKKLTEKFVFRDNKGFAYCRIVPWKCKYVQKTKYVYGNFVRHFRSEHPNEARAAGFFTEKPDTEAVPKPGPIETVTVESTAVETSQQQNPYPERFQHNTRKIKNFDGSLTFTQLTEKCIVRSKEGVHCRIVPWPPCRYVQKSKYAAGNFVRHFRTEHPEEARKIGFFKGFSLSDPESVELELPLVTFPNDLETESIVEPDEPCPDTPHDDPALYCRLCFAVDLPLAPIFSGPDAAEDNPLVEAIEECINVRLTTDDDAWICSECSQKLVEFQEFRQLSRIYDSAVRQKKRRLNNATTVVVQSANEADTFYVEVVKQEYDIEAKTELPETEGTSTAAAEQCEDQKPFIELPNGTFSCRLCPETFPSLGPTMEHFISAHSDAMHTTVDYSDKPPFKAVTINNVQYVKCADCDTLTEHGEAIIEHRKRFHTGEKVLVKINCDRAGCKQFFMDQPAYLRHLEICHDRIDPGEGVS